MNFNTQKILGFTLKVGVITLTVAIIAWFGLSIGNQDRSHTDLKQYPIVILTLEDDPDCPYDYEPRRYFSGDEYLRVEVGDTVYSPQGYAHVVLEKTVLYE
ncbi:MAG: hypothetical protein GF315_10030 [candidate division Zixibacteria bacterium]|nr:hypothetical protein [candidate division Zixibacteria bacterium]